MLRIFASSLLSDLFKSNDQTYSYMRAEQKPGPSSLSLIHVTASLSPFLTRTWVKAWCLLYTQKRLSLTLSLLSCLSHSLSPLLSHSCLTT